MAQSNIILCLAHYCDTHGPTPLMVTEGLSVDCPDCPDDEVLLAPVTSDRRHRNANPSGGPRSQSAAAAAAAAVAAVTGSLHMLGLQSQSRSASVPEQDTIGARAALFRAAASRPGDLPSSSSAAAAAAALDTPPDSPRRRQDSRRDSAFRRTYDEYVTKRASPCDNCAMTLPERQDGNGPSGPNSLRADVRGPTLRTRAPYAKVYGSGGQTPPVSHSSASSDSGGEERRRQSQSQSQSQYQSQSQHTTNGVPIRTSSSSSSSSSSSAAAAAAAAAAHTHYLNYTSTHEPVKPESFSIVRASCLRTLSFETLPRAPSAASAAAIGLPASTTSPQSPTMPSSSQFVTTHSAGAAVSGGPIFFGDPTAGYTTAYIFRIPDVHARGHKRVYAFMAISTYPESTTIKTFGYVSAAFQDLAMWIQRLAESEAEVARLASPTYAPPWHPFGAYPAAGGAGLAQDMSADRRNSGSSYLSSGGGGLARRMGGGPGFAPRARGLAELVGLPDFFIQLHRRFVPILFELSIRMNS